MERSYPSAKKQSVYSTAQANWASVVMVGISKNEEMMYSVAIEKMWDRPTDGGQKLKKKWTKMVCVGWKNMWTCFQTWVSSQIKKRRKNIIGKVD